jgi:hypothetical protein
MFKIKPFRRKNYEFVALTSVWLVLQTLEAGFIENFPMIPVRI